VSVPVYPPRKPPLRGLLHGVLATARAATPAHAVLRNRLVGVGVVSVVIDAACGGLAWAFEGGHGNITTFWNALFWTTTQMLTVSSQFPNPLTTGGKLLDVFLQFYAITVVTSIAGTFASFFHHLSLQRHAHEPPAHG
jgi:hypothetical protein